ncbi:cytosine-specific methyltransferase [Escherichia coli]|nr:cytosine-specific methyltransferase [Escherichia coli]
MIDSNAKLRSIQMPFCMLPQIQVMPLNSLRISLADYVQLSLQAGFIQRPAIRHPYHHVKG